LEMARAGQGRQTAGLGLLKYLHHPQKRCGTGAVAMDTSAGKAPQAKKVTREKEWTQTRE